MKVRGQMFEFGVQRFLLGWHSCLVLLLTLLSHNRYAREQLQPLAPSVRRPGAVMPLVACKDHPERTLLLLDCTCAPETTRATARGWWKTGAKTFYCEECSASWWAAGARDEAYHALCWGCKGKLLDHRFKNQVSEVPCSH